MSLTLVNIDCSRKSPARTVEVFSPSAHHHIVFHKLNSGSVRTKLSFLIKSDSPHESRDQEVSTSLHQHKLFPQTVPLLQSSFPLLVLLGWWRWVSCVTAGSWSFTFTHHGSVSAWSACSPLVMAADFQLSGLPAALAEQMGAKWLFLEERILLIPFQQRFSSRWCRVQQIQTSSSSSRSLSYCCLMWKVLLNHPKHTASILAS